MGYEGSWLSILFPGQDLTGILAEDEQRFLPTLRRQVGSKLKDSLGPDCDELLTLSSELYAVHVNGTWHLSDLSGRLEQLAAKHAVSLELGGEHHGV